MSVDESRSGSREQWGGGTARPAATQAQTEAAQDPVPVFEATVGSLGCCGQSGQTQPAQPGVRVGRAGSGNCDETKLGELRPE